VPYGIYDLAANMGWVNVGIDNDTAAFAGPTIRRWWRNVGRVRYSLPRRRRITAPFGGLARRRRRRRAGGNARCNAAPMKSAYRRGSPLPAGTAQMEQDRAQPRLVHPPELARQTLAQLSRDRRSYRGDNQQNRIEGLPRTGPQQPSQRHRRLGCRNGQPQHPTRGFPRRMELYDRSIKPSNVNEAIVSCQALRPVRLMRAVCPVETFCLRNAATRG
jgi:Rhodopirellula transposase DDE domain